MHSNRGSTHTFVLVLSFKFIGLCFWIFIVTMGLIHCGFGAFLFLTQGWFLKLGLLYILLMFFSLSCYSVYIVVCTHAAFVSF